MAADQRRYLRTDVSRGQRGSLRIEDVWPRINADLSDTDVSRGHRGSLRIEDVWPRINANLCERMSAADQRGSLRIEVSRGSTWMYAVVCHGSHRSSLRLRNYTAGVVAQIVLALAAIAGLLLAVLGIWVGVNQVILIAMRVFPLVGKRRR